jgi:hypothetical protein
MSNYTKTTNFTAKDALSSGDSAKIVKGTEIDVEFTAIATAIATKQDTGGSVSLTSGVTGTLPIANGGTGATTFTTGSVLVGNGTAIYQQIAPSTSGNVLTSNGTTWYSAAPSGGGGSSGVSSFTVSNSVSGMTVSASASTGAITLTTAISSGSTFRSGISAAASGANTDITSLTGLTTALAVGYGGTGSTSLAGAGIVTTTGTQTISGDKTFSGTNVYGSLTSTSGLAGDTYGFYLGSSSGGLNTNAGNIAVGFRSGTGWLITSTYIESSVADVRKPSGGSFNTSSDERLKTIQGTYTLGLDAIKQLSPIKFKYNDHEKNAKLPTAIKDNTYIGLIAQAVEQTSLSGMVSTDPDGYKSINNSELV